MKKIVINIDEVIKELYAVAGELHSALSDENVSDFRKLIEHNEVAIGLEILVEQLYESDGMVPENAFNVLKRISQEFLDDSYLCLFKDIKVRKN